MRLVNTATAVVLVLAGIFAVGNWVSRVGDRRLLEYLTKPTVTALLAVAILTLDARDSGTRTWFFVGMLLSLAGDVFLMLPKEQFVAGLGSFLLAHIAYVVGFLVGGISGTPLAVGFVLVVAVLVPLGRVILAGAKRTSPADAPAVAFYILVIGTMIVASFGSTKPLAIAGAITFAFSDSLIAWSRFVKPFRGASVAIMVTYHLGQLGLVLSLLR